MNSSDIETQIQAELGQEEVPLRAVSCPDRVAIAPDNTFTCIGELESATTFPIAVTQMDDQGTIEWEVPNSKGLLNLELIEAEIREAIATESNSNAPTLDCGGAYRINQPGSSFECKVANAAPIKQGQTETLLLNIVVQLDPQGNITWQQIRRQQTIASAAVPGARQAASPNAGNTATPASTNETEPASEPATTTAPAADQTAEDFLNQPGALDDF
ncbi:DUF4333 domain-containing protein [Oscillatoria sp. FACHB-1407]|nr:DUF4333 domain-containing protein [Oscillatoria sp. FACHB-1407]